MRFFSYRDRPVHLGPYPLERLTRSDSAPDLAAVSPMQGLSFDDPDPESLKHALARYIGMFDLVRDGAVNPQPGEVPLDPQQRSDHMKAAGYFFDASMMAVGKLPASALLAAPIRNPMVAAIGAELAQSQPVSFAAGMDMILADVMESARTLHGPIEHHSDVVLILVEYPRDPKPGEPGCDWIIDTQAQRAAVLCAQTAVLLSTYLRMLGHAARAHSATCSEVDLGRLAVACGLAHADGSNPYIGKRYGLAAVSTTFALTPDRPLAPASQQQRWQSHGPAWWLGKGTLKSAFNREAFQDREFRLGAFPFEDLKRVDTPTTFIDHERVPRFPKRADFFARSLFGDLGKAVQDGAKNAHYVLKSPIGACARRALGALLLLQFGDARGPVSPTTADPKRNADNLKATSYYLGVDAVGLCAVPDWAYYSHDAGGNTIAPYHSNGVNLLLDQGHETMEGASGDDWISVAQSMRAYLRFSMLGGVIGEQLRRLGYSARVHSVLDGDVLQPPLLLLSGLGEVSRIGEVILNPYLGPRLKSGTVTTDMPMAYDKPIDFGLQTFCQNCNKCARECPSGAITAGPKLMVNGYEIYKSDAEKCARYRITNAAGGMCGRCMKTCPWNLEGLFAESGLRWLAMNLPASARVLAELDDKLDRGSINPVKKWWWDVELDRSTGRYVQAPLTNRRGLQKDLNLKYEDQTLAVYPADRMPPPYPVTFVANREEGIDRYKALLTPAQHKARIAAGDTDGLVPQFTLPAGEAPVFPVLLKLREEMAPQLAKYEFTALDGSPLPRFDAGAHIDIVIAPEYQRQYSLAGDPADRSKYVLGVLREAPDRGGRGGSALMHRVFREGRTVFITKPTNHFPLIEDATLSLLFAGGIGVTPLVAMAHRLHALGRRFELHYSAASRSSAGFLRDLAQAPWQDKVSYHFKDEGARADLARLMPPYQPGAQVYTCGASRYMDGVFEAALARGWPEDAMQREYFSLPEADAWVNQAFTLRLRRSGRVLTIPPERSATDVLAQSGIKVDTKCSDGLCGVCATPYDASASDQIEHRDFVLGRKERAHKLILCCSRARHAGGEIVVDL